MLTKENIAVLLVGVFVLVVAAYLLFPQRELPVNETKENQPEPEPEVCPEYKAKFGGKPDVKEDGKFGCETYYAVRQLTGLDVKEGINLIDIK